MKGELQQILISENLPFNVLEQEENSTAFILKKALRRKGL